MALFDQSLSLKLKERPLSDRTPAAVPQYPPGSVRGGGAGGGCAVTVNLPDRNLTRQTENRLKVFSLFLLFLRADTHGCNKTGCKHWICYVLVRVSLRGGSNRQPFNPVVPNKKTKKQIQM